MLNGIFQRPYLAKDAKSLVKKQQDDENTQSANREEQTNQNSRSKGLQYVEENKPSYTPAYQNQEQQVDWRQMRSQIQAQARNSQNTNVHTTETPQITPTKDLSGRSR